MHKGCPYVDHVDQHHEVDRYGNPRDTVTVWSAVPLSPATEGYDADRAAQVLAHARGYKAERPDADVRVREVVRL